MKCKTCRWWGRPNANVEPFLISPRNKRADFKTCGNPIYEYGGEIKDQEENDNVRFVYMDAGEFKAGFITSPEFGCAGWEKHENDKDV